MHSPAPTRHKLGLSILVLLILAAAASPTLAATDAVPAINSASNAPTLLRTPSADNPMLSDSNSAVNQAPLPGDITPSGSDSTTSGASSNSVSYSTAAFGSMLRPSEQCGGDGGFCNSTTIGVPCGDHVWNGIECPEYYYCARQNYTYWSCQEEPPEVVKAAKAAQAQQAARARNTTRQTNSSTYNVTDSSDVEADGEFSASAAVGDSSRRGTNTTSNRTLVLDPNSLRTQSGAARQQVGPTYVLTVLMLFMAVLL